LIRAVDDPDDADSGELVTIKKVAEASRLPQPVIAQYNDRQDYHDDHQGTQPFLHGRGCGPRRGRYCNGMWQRWQAGTNNDQHHHDEQHRHDDRDIAATTGRAH
jgi:hypothetical protein